MSSDVQQQLTRKGLIIVNTGDGKGKTTAALGTLIRAWGRGMRPCMIQFIKSEEADYGEVRAAQQMGIEWYRTGDGCTWNSKDLVQTAALACSAWEMAQQKIVSGEYDLIVLDEFTYPLKYEWLNTEEVVAWLRDHKPPLLHLIITGRSAPEALIDLADLVTEMQKVKHPYDQDVPGQPGIEF